MDWENPEMAGHDIMVQDKIRQEDDRYQISLGGAPPRD